MKTLCDYIKLFIKEKYITNDTKKIKILLNSKEYTSVEIVIVNKNNFSLLSKIENLLDLPVLKAKVFYNDKLSNIDLEETEDIMSGEIKIHIIPRLKDLGNDFILYFDCIKLPKIYTDSFLYKLDILNPSLYYTLKEYNNTVISYMNYKRAIEYVHKNKIELCKMYNINKDSDHNILEKIYKKILELKNDSFVIHSIDDCRSIYPYYIIETTSKHSKKPMSKN